MSGYNPKSCNADSLPYYTPLQVAIRWCGLISNEPHILSKMAGNMADEVSSLRAYFPQWPCLTANFMRIHSAMNNGQLEYGRDGRCVAPDDHVASDRRTVDHDDLKKWIKDYHPSQIEHCKFLFDDIERQAHPAITIEVYQSACAERDSYKAKLKAANEKLADQEMQIQAMGKMIEGAKEGQKLKNNKREFMLSLVEILLGDAARGYTPHKIANELTKIAEGKGKVLPDVRTIRSYLRE